MTIERQNRIQSGRRDAIHRFFNVLKIPSEARLVQADIKGFWKENNFGIEILFVSPVFSCAPPLCFDHRSAGLRTAF